MRKSIILATAVLSSAIALSGCMDNRTGDVGNKNIRPNAIRGNDINGLNGMNRSRFANDQDNEQNRMYGERRENNNVVGMHGNSRIEASDKVAEKIAAMPEIDTAFVMMTDRNAYVAVTQDNDKRTGASPDLTDAIKDKVADQVKALSPSVENVYVSANADFVGRMQGYANDVRAGNPIQGLITEFNALVERVFPQPAGTRNR
ncbi:YhcN/YlaJ family sporulation lipoprotein [Cohnella luojiensis]|uniref:YhcN/YlaJ family sporulation lipoprotein n=1 Tax=Cohnella luojiensis TaxID=652876 RepID=A0A4Y8M5K9_9BACL|nr:YhcN/YlaJ family sporulation lipoprotein [Cohnella luojiensis]TFE27841.1 YhcN/YlaJ family sporulation lipoprotein [Cohnella luojiensis]